jgi:hypothetical protein
MKHVQVEWTPGGAPSITCIINMFISVSKPPYYACILDGDGVDFDDDPVLMISSVVVWY